MCKLLAGLVLSFSSLCALEPDAHSFLEIEKNYHHKLFEKSDINEHIPHLRRLAGECASVIEIGLRSMNSTWGIMMGLAENTRPCRSYLGIDIDAPPTALLQQVKSLAEAQEISFDFWKVSDLQIDIPETDLLFIDSLHTYMHLTYELEKFSSCVRKYIAIHDTSWPWGTDDDPYYGKVITRLEELFGRTGLDRAPARQGIKDSDYPKWISRKKTGLWTAVTDFLSRHPEWSLHHRYLNNHGFTILRRTSATCDQSPLNRVETLLLARAREKWRNSAVEEAIKHRMILCTGPSFGRKIQLKSTTDRDSALIPFKKIFVATNDPEIMDIAFERKPWHIQLIPNIWWQYDCANTIIATIKQVLCDPECTDNDILIFKHESVYIYDMHLVAQAVEKLLQGYDMVVRYVSLFDAHANDVFLMKVSAARQVFKNLQYLHEFPPGISFCEQFFTQAIVKNTPRVFEIHSDHLSRRENALGFYHVPPNASEALSSGWDMSNYGEVYN